MSPILIVTTSFPQETPGGEAAGAFVADFAQALSDHVATHVIAPGSHALSERRGSYSVHRFPAPKQPLSQLRLGRPMHWPAIASTLTAGSKAVADAVRTHEPSHIVALWALPSGYWASRASRNHDVPYSVWALGSDIWSLSRLPVVRSVLKRVLQGAENRFADGFELAHDVEDICGKRCEFLPSARALRGVDRPARAEAPPYKLAYLGRWHRNKGIDLLLEAFGLLDDTGWSRIGEVRIAGGGPMAAAVETNVSALRRRGRPISMQGYLGKSEAIALLSWADFVLIPSRIESIPVVLSDALQCGCAVIACPVGDLPLVISRYRMGVLASSANARALKHAIGAALEAGPLAFQPGIVAGRSAFAIATSARSLLAAISVPSD